MDQQTTISQFFTARKSSFSSCIPPAKRTKLDDAMISRNSPPQNRREKSTTRKQRTNNARSGKASKKITKTSDDIVQFTVNDLLGSKPIEEIKKCTVDNGQKSDAGKKVLVAKNGHLLRRRDQLINADNLDHQGKASAVTEKLQSSKPTPKAPSVPLKERVCRPIPILDSQSLSQGNDNDQQTKAILLSRGSAILKAGYENNKIKSPSKASEILSCLSPQKSKMPKSNNADGNLEIIGSPRKSAQLKSPCKLSEVLKTLTPKKVNGCDQTDDQQKGKESSKESSNELPALNVTARRERLRNKFKHLLKPEANEQSSTTTTTTSLDLDKTEQENVSVKEKAHEKFQHLAKKATPSTFVIPTKFKILVEMFRCIDSILFLLNQRSEVCTFQKLKKSVQSMCSRNFELEHLAKIKTVYPNGFTFRQEKGLRSTQGSSKSYQLTIEANFNESMPSKSKKITSNALITRKLQFENNLLSIVKKHHQNFLQSLNMKICDSQIHRWHPHFKLDEVPDIELSSLPQPPIVKDFKNAADLIKCNRNLAPKVHNALSNVAKNQQSEEKGNVIIEKDHSKNNTDGEVKEKSSNSNAKLKGVSSSILERIRQKEMNKMQLAMTRDPVKEERLSKIQRLPEICRILKSYFTTEKKVAITLEDCIQKLCESYGTSVNLVKLEEHVRLLAELVPEWLTIAMVRKYPFVKISKVYDINKVINTLNTSLTKESET